MLTGKYLQGSPEDGRANREKSLKRSAVTERAIESVRALNGIVATHGRSLARMAIARVPGNEEITSASIGASKLGQVVERARGVGHSSSRERSSTPSTRQRARTLPCGRDRRRPMTDCETMNN